jgi:hypothetical protein
MPQNPDATVIPDKAEVWLALASNVTNIATMIPATATADLAALGWEETGLIDAPKGIPLTPSVEVKEYDAFGRPAYRTKLKKGKLKSGFTALEWNSVTRKVVLPGSGPNKIGAPKNVLVYVLYRFSDDDFGAAGSRVWVSLRPAPVELTSLGGVVDGEQSLQAEMLVHHAPDSSGDVFQTVAGAAITKVFTIAAGVTAYTTTVDGQTTTSITAKDKDALQNALRALPNVGPAGVTVTGTTGGPLTAVFSVPATIVTAAGTGGTVTVA